ncbi:hypothetical protein SDC9_57119 [bioreactor metagenome]|uniref:YicC family protein n=1 Tax=bioreactor metagenome TaxID=1076179 RepID=A0A644X9H3_9ZZZZ
MTGYGRGEAKLNGRTITVEIRAVNNRYLDCSVKIPRIYIFAEDSIKAKVQSAISRGNVDVFVTIGSESCEGITVSVNKPVAEGYYKALQELCEGYSLRDDISVSLLSRFSDVLLVEKNQENLEEVASDICQVLDAALIDFNAMREREGKRLAEDIRSRGETIRAFVGVIEERSPQIVNEYRAKLEARMAEVLKNTQLDESRILTEAAIFADKVAVDEETVRLRSHLDQMAGMLDAGGVVGRKLDFLIQEFNREANTIGSKCSDLELTRVVVNIKSEIEKIREQVQNLE